MKKIVFSPPPAVSPARIRHDFPNLARPDLTDELFAAYDQGVARTEGLVVYPERSLYSPRNYTRWCLPHPIKIIDTMEAAGAGMIGVLYPDPAAHKFIQVDVLVTPTLTPGQSSAYSAYETEEFQASIQSYELSGGIQKDLRKCPPISLDNPEIARSVTSLMSLRIFDLEGLESVMTKNDISKVVVSVVFAVHKKLIHPMGHAAMIPVAASIVQGPSHYARDIESRKALLDAFHVPGSQGVALLRKFLRVKALSPLIHLEVMTDEIFDRTDFPYEGIPLVYPKRPEYEIIAAPRPGYSLMDGCGYSVKNTFLLAPTQTGRYRPDPTQPDVSDLPPASVCEDEEGMSDSEWDTTDFGELDRMEDVSDLIQEHATRMHREYPDIDETEYEPADDDELDDDVPLDAMEIRKLAGEPLIGIPDPAGEEEEFDDDEEDPIEPALTDQLMEWEDQNGATDNTDAADQDHYIKLNNVRLVLQAVKTEFSGGGSSYFLMPQPMGSGVILPEDTPSAEFELAAEADAIPLNVPIKLTPEEYSGKYVTLRSIIDVNIPAFSIWTFQKYCPVCLNPVEDLGSLEIPAECICTNCTMLLLGAHIADVLGYPIEQFNQYLRTPGFTREHVIPFLMNEVLTHETLKAGFKTFSLAKLVKLLGWNDPKTDKPIATKHLNALILTAGPSYWETEHNPDIWNRQISIADEPTEIFEQIVWTVAPRWRGPDTEPMVMIRHLIETMKAAGMGLPGWKGDDTKNDSRPGREKADQRPPKPDTGKKKTPGKARGADPQLLLEHNKAGKPA